MADEIKISTTFEWLPEEERSFQEKLGKLWSTWRRQPLGLIGGFLIVFFVLLAFFASAIAPHDPEDFAGTRLEAPSFSFLLGTDNLGRDVLSRTIYGAQVSIAAGLASAFIAVGLGSTFGLISAYAGGWADLVIQRLLEVLASFPGLILALIMISVLGRSDSRGGNLLQVMWDLRSLEAAIGLTLVFAIMRIIRAAVLKERSLPYIEAGISIGATPVRIIWRHIAPNIFPFVLISFSTIIGATILIEASLSFLGFGVSAGTPSWGADLSSRNREFFTIAPWLVVGPGVALSLTVLSYNFFGDALRDILDPRLRGSQ